MEGLTELRLAASAGVSIRSVFHDPALADVSLFAGAHEVIATSPDALARAAMRGSTEGFVAVVDQRECSLAALDTHPDPLVLVIESIEKPGNLGAMLRTADAAGASAVIVADPTTDVWNPNVIRASLGSAFTVPIGVGSTSEVLGWLLDRHISLCVTTPGADHSLFDTDLTGAVALAIGAEHAGLSSAFLEAADHPVRIPMFGTADSLNAAVAAAISLYEAVRQRARA